MARRPRIFAPGLLYHVIVRGNQRQKTFYTKRDYLAYLERLGKYRLRYKVSIYAYCLMPNHIHLLLQCSSVPLSRFMQGLQQSYTQSFNRVHHKVGHLFQGRYKAIICQKDEYLLELVRYIHLNPVRSKLVRRPEQYPYSGHRSYLEARGAEVLEAGPVLKLVGGRKGYRRFIFDGLGEGHKEEYYEAQDQRFLGTEEFGKNVREQVQEESRESLKTVVEKLAGWLKISLAALRGPDRSWGISRARGLVVYILVRRLGFPVVEVGAYFGRDATSVSVIAGRFSDRMEKDDGTREEYERITKIV